MPLYAEIRTDLGDGVISGARSGLCCCDVASLILRLACAFKFTGNPVVPCCKADPLVPDKKATKLGWQTGKGSTTA